MKDAIHSNSDELANLLGAVVDDYLEQRAQGQRPDVAMYVDKYPEHGEVIRNSLQALEVVGQTLSSSAAGEAPDTSDFRPKKTLGDYRVIRELGRGGMGVVYEAEQLSMGRRVALKVVPFAAMVDQRMLKRFHNEVRAAAALEHPNIVPVYFVGEERGVHYYAMQLIQGRTLADVIGQLRELRTGEGSLDGGSISRALSGATPVPESETPGGRPVRNALDGSSVPELRGADTTHRPTPAREYYRSVAALGQQVADALHHAHENGILHRDIKPGNLLLDATGRAFVADFGLARIEADAGVTMTGDVVGTLRYMAPEQALAQRVIVDHRADIYSLGMTLYELLTLRPAYDESDRQVLLKQIAFGEPEKPTRVDRAIPTELETIILKAISKSPEDRYNSARELADDFSHYLHDMPIRARRPTLTQIAGKWTRRNKTLVRTASLTLGIAVVISGALLWSAFEREAFQRRRAEKNLAAAKVDRRKAIEAEDLAKEQEQLAKQQRDAAEYDTYVANIQLAGREWAAGRAPFEQLQDVVPELGRPDYRGWEYRHLYSQVHPEVYEYHLQMPGGLDDVLAWKPDGSHLATVDVTGVVNLWDMGTGKLASSLKGCPGNIHSICWSPDGGKLAAGSDANLIVIWDADSGKVEQTIRDHPTTVMTLDWHPSETRIAAGCADGKVRIWDIQSGQSLAVLESGEDAIRSLDWHSSGKYLLAGVGDQNRSVVAWNMATGTSVFNMRVNKLSGPAHFVPGKDQISAGGGSGGKPISTIALDFQTVLRHIHCDGSLQTAWSPDGSRLVTSSLENSLKIFDTDSDEVPSAVLPGHASYVQQLAWSPTGHLLASSDIHGNVKVWNVGAPLRTLLARNDGFAWRQLEFSPDGRHLLLSGNKVAAMWEVEGQIEGWRRKYAVNIHQGLNWNPEGTQFVATGTGAQMLVCDAETGAPIHPPIRFDGVRPHSVDWQTDGRRVAVGLTIGRSFQSVGRVQLFDTDNWTRLADVSASVCTPYSPIQSVAWSPDGRHLAASGSKTSIFDADLRERKQLAFSSNRARWSPSGRYLALLGPEQVEIVDTTDWTQVAQLAGHSFSVVDLEWHPSEPRLVSCDWPGIVRIWDTTSWTEVALLDMHAWTPALDWSPDGQRLAAASWVSHQRFPEVADEVQRKDMLADGSTGIVQLMDGTHGDNATQHMQGLRQRAATLARQSEYSAAFAIFDHLQERFPNDTDLRTQVQRVRWLQADYVAIEGDLVRATEAFERLSQETAHFDDYRLRLPSKLFAAGKHDQAIAMAEDAVEAFPDRREYRDTLGALYEAHVLTLCQDGEFDKAIPSLGKLANRFGTRTDFRPTLAFEIGKSHQLQDVMEFIGQLATAFEEREDYRPELAQRLAATNNPRQALLVYEALLASGSDTDEIRAGRAAATIALLIREKRLSEAADVLADQPPTLNLDAPRRKLGYALGNRGVQHTEDQRFEDAIADWSQAFELLDGTEGQSTTGYWLALLQLCTGREEEYRSTCARMIEQFSQTEDPWSAHWMAWTCGLAPDATQDKEAVLAASRTSYDAHPENVSFLNTLGAILYRQGKFERAIRQLNEASELADKAIKTSPAYTWFLLSMAHQQLGQTEEALEWFTKAKRLSEVELTSESVRWNRRLTLELFEKEAKALMAP